MPNNQTIKTITQIQTIENQHGAINPNDWTYGLIDSKHTKSLKLNNRLIFIDDEVQDKLHQAGAINISSIVIILTIIIVHKIIQKCWPNRLLRRFSRLKKKSKRRALNRTKHIILSKKKEFSDDSATEEEENTKYHEQKIVF